MAVYNCFECDNWLDGDYFPPSEHPDDSCACICENCLSDLEEQADLEKDLQQLAAENQREVESGLKRA